MTGVEAASEREGRDVATVDGDAEPDGAVSESDDARDDLSIFSGDGDDDGGRDVAPAIGDGEGSRTPPVERRRLRLEGGTVGLVVLVVLAVVCVALITAVVIKTRNDALLAAREAAAYTPPPLTSSGPAADASSIAIVGDETASRAASGVTRARRWPALLGSTLGSDVDLGAAAGAGYTTSTGGGTFVEEAARVPSQARYVIFVGGAADAGTSALSVARAATRAYAAAAKQAPGATVLVVGPLFRPSSVPEAEFTELRTTLRSATRIAGVRWVDPIGSGWTPSVDSTSDFSGTLERTIAARLQEAVRSTSD